MHGDRGKPLPPHEQAPSLIVTALIGSKKLKAAGSRTDTLRRRRSARSVGRLSEMLIDRVLTDDKHSGSGEFDPMQRRAKVCECRRRNIAQKPTPTSLSENKQK